ncbi:DUF5107 domain-containing protein [Paenibacillus sp. HB172176]|uniref:DUF5107 domain-containing protein n=1 Tax=Paenibacillus sp. HB172176 TaxID=2493690 RepID=UPI00143B6A7C|nr:DUF5107 domain-containing protein [Paenibacillus sp. HB172176]
MAAQAEVKVWEQTIELPTYEVGKPDQNPMFLEKRVYQGSSGRVYPHPVIDKVYDEKVMKPYRMVFLENEFIQIQLMPELGGRIYRALDKTNQYDFVYYNRVIKPALVGLAGPWISGGIEFNWPQHHRPNTYGPVDCDIRENEDGSKTVWVGEIDRMYGTKVTTGFTLHPGKAYLEISAQLYNRTAEPQTFLWWANPAVAVNDYTQSVFPPDVHAVFDHGKRDVSKFPIATGTYYKMDYSEGVDISRYRNIPVPTSYMAYHSDFDFVGGYDHDKKAGILHIANKHVSPGKKQWTWGHGEFGQAWDRNLTDEDGPYIELMTGVYTDNQPDFTWLQPYEEKSFKQYFMPYKEVGMVKNATIDAAVNLEINERQTTITVYATSIFEQARIVLSGKQRDYIDQTIRLSPTQTFSASAVLEEGEEEQNLSLVVLDHNGNELVSYRPTRKGIEKTPEPAKAIGEPADIRSTEGLYLAGQHLEQYRHATYEPDPYYLEGLKRDPDDIRLNNAYGLLLLRRGQFQDSEAYFRRAIATLTRHNARPYDAEPFFHLGKSLKWQDRREEAFAAFYKSVWSGAWQSAGYLELAQLAAGDGKLDEALELIERSLSSHYHNLKARLVKTALLRKLKRFSESERLALETSAYDPMDFGSRHELFLICQAAGKAEGASKALHALVCLMRDDVHNYISLAQDYADMGLYEEALELLSRMAERTEGDVYPMVHYYQGYFHHLSGDDSSCNSFYERGEQAESAYCFPNTIADYLVLSHAAESRRNDAKARYYLGNLLYDKKRHLDAATNWEASAALDNSFATVHRNLALAYYNKQNKPDEAMASLLKAQSLAPEDARVFYELDQLSKKLSYSAEQRLTAMETHKKLIEARDDLYLEYVTLHNFLGRHEEALKLILTRSFHPWEGGEGKVPAQYVLARVELARQLLAQGKADEAVHQLNAAKQYPLSLNEGKLEGAQENNIDYYLGNAYHRLGRSEEARKYWLLASKGLSEPASAMFYNDQPPHMIYYQGAALRKLGLEREARSRFNKLVDYGEQHLFQSQKIDYFAVSLPDFLVFDENLDNRNRIHCHYMIALGSLGLEHAAEAEQHFHEVLKLEPAHQGAALHLDLLR